jgi:hypothetical protein
MKQFLIKQNVETVEPAPEQEWKNEVWDQIIQEGGGKFHLRRLAHTATVKKVRDEWINAITGTRGIPIEYLEQKFKDHSWLADESSLEFNRRRAIVVEIESLEDAERLEPDAAMQYLEARRIRQGLTVNQLGDQLLEKERRAAS